MKMVDQFVEIHSVNLQYVTFTLFTSKAVIEVFESYSFFAEKGITSVRQGEIEDFRTHPAAFIAPYSAAKQPSQFKKWYSHCLGCEHNFKTLIKQGIPYEEAKKVLGPFILNPLHITMTFSQVEEFINYYNNLKRISAPVGLYDLLETLRRTVKAKLKERQNAQETDQAADQR